METHSTTQDLNNMSSIDLENKASEHIILDINNMRVGRSLNKLINSSKLKQCANSIIPPKSHTDIETKLISFELFCSSFHFLYEKAEEVEMVSFNMLQQMKPPQSSSKVSLLASILNSS